MDNRQLTVDVLRGATRDAAFSDGRSYSCGLPVARAGVLADQADGCTVIAPMPGLVRAELTETGAMVVKCKPLLAMEAMKMEQSLPVPRDGVVAELLAC